MILGMDFGTTNSGIAVHDGRTLRTLPIDPAGAGGAVDRTALYVTHDHGITIGQQAVDRYLAQNVGRPVKMERVRVGTISVTAAEIGTYYRDVYIERDVLAPGRLFTSFKTFLSSASYEGTVVGGVRYTLDDIVAAYLRVARLRAERVLGQDVRAIVLGRPVAFSHDPAADALARDRLVGAAFRAGYETVYLQYEPVAAAYQYETTLERERIVLIFDFGGGTLDVTVMRLGNPKARAVLATGGLPVAGDVFDQRIVRQKLARFFGEGSSYGPPQRRRPVPAWIYDTLADWQEIMSLQQPESRAILEEIAASADRPREIKNLIALAARNYGLPLYAAAEEAKRALSDAPEATIRFDGPGFALREPLTRSEFEALIREETDAVERMLVGVVREAGLTPGAIDAVVRTGGSSRIPVFADLLGRLFGAEKVRSIDPFSSVTAGLAVVARRIAAGEIDIEAQRPEREQPDDASPSDDTRMPVVDRGFLAAWVTAQEQAMAAPNRGAAAAWVTTDYRLVAATLPGFAPDGSAPVVPQGVGPETALANRAALAGLDDQIVLITSAYRLLLTTPRQLLVLDRSGVRMPQLYGFARGEVICALAAWDAVRAQARLAIVSGRGVVWTVDTERLRGRLDRAIPFSLETPPESDPVALAGVDQGQRLAVVTSVGRALRVELPDASARGVPAFKRSGDEKIVGCVAVRDDDRLLLVAPDGAARLLPASRIPVAVEPNSRGKVVASRIVVRSVILADPATRPWLLTTRRLRPVDPALLRTTAALSGKSFPLAALDQDEQVHALLPYGLQKFTL